MKRGKEQSCLDFKSAFESASEKSAEGSNNRAEDGHREGMKQEWNHGDSVFSSYL